VTDADLRNAYFGHKDVLHRFARRMTGSDDVAEDVVQDCFLALSRRPAAYDPTRGALRAFLLGIARNLILKRWRDEHPQESLDHHILITPPIDLVSIERAEAVARAVQSLPPLQREALILAEYEGLSLEEIAHATDAEIAAVKSRLHRARENLRRMLAPLLERRGYSYGT
jgi:RNA polymerase sigma-70 factor (ECF subfamily)